jgi:hypothetical protein
MRPAEARAVRIALPVILAVLLAVGLTTLPGENATSCRDFRLSRGTWQVAREGSLETRSPTTAEALASDLVRCRVTIGMTGRVVRSLLGRPDRTTASGARRVWLYQLDLERGILSEPKYLRLVFGTRCAVMSAQLATTS